MATSIEVLKLRARPPAHAGLAPLAGVSLRVRPGEILAVIGDRGSGAGTLARALVGPLPEGVVPRRVHPHLDPTSCLGQRLGLSRATVRQVAVPGATGARAAASSRARCWCSATARRLAAQASSFEPSTAGRSLP